MVMVSNSALGTANLPIITNYCFWTANDWLVSLRIVSHISPENGVGGSPRRKTDL